MNEERHQARVLVTGETGYVGGCLISRLNELKLEVRCMARRPFQLIDRVSHNVEIVHGDVNEPVTLDSALKGVDTAFYLVLSYHEGQSRILAFNKLDGTIPWQSDRNKISSWTTPVAAQINGRTEVITATSNVIISYDAESGKVIWEASGLTICAAASSVVADGKVYCSTGFCGVSTMTIELGHEGNFTDIEAVS
jgi:hypothetical protein